MKKLIYSIALGSTLTIVPTISHAALGDTTLKYGMKSQDVKQLQQSLKNKGYFSAGTTTYFGSITKDALMKFQRANHLSADGIAGKNTYRALLSGATVSSSTKVSSTGLLKQGSRGAAVQQVQQLLKSKGYFKANTTTYFGPITRDAVMNFQRANHLSVDGVVGSATLKALNGGGASASTVSSSTSSSATLKLGMSGSSVTSLQSKLKSKGYLKVSPTGYYGSLTKNAVMALQRAHGLSVDGVAGPATMRALGSTSSVSSTSSVKGITSQDKATQIISIGKQYMGVPYVWGGSSPSGFDCSGFINYVFAKAGVSVPRTAATIYSAGQSVSSPSVGDLVFFETYKPGPSHVGIYLGNGQFLNASSSRGVTITDMNTSYWQSRYLGAKSYY
ncbi:peptidoglycan-binding protein [Priestia koreensis]|uniref:C40 family peptidase n=1 Tax=Priestia koreensis TaxID=284581 RepID=UPI0034586424